MITISTIIPLNVALMNIELFNPIVDPNATDSSIEIEHVSFIGADNLVLASENTDDRDQKYWTNTDPENHLIGLYGFKKDNIDDEITLRFHSNTGEFAAEIPQITLFDVNDIRSAKIPKQLPKLTHDNLIIDEKEATFTFRLRDYLSDWKGYHKINLSVDEKLIGHFYVAIDVKREKKLLPYKTELASGYRVYELFCPEKLQNEDATKRQIIPICRLAPTNHYDYIALYNELIKGAKPHLGLETEKAVPYSGDFWIERGEMRLRYRKENLENFKNLEDLYSAVAYTFNSYGNVKTANVFIDGTLSKTITVPLPPYYYLPYENNTDYIYVIKMPASGASESLDDKNISSFISEFIEVLKGNNITLQGSGIIPPMTKLINCELDDEGELIIELKEYDYVENTELFELLLSLTAYNYEGVKNVLLNGEVLPKITQYNLEQ